MGSSLALLIGPGRLPSTGMVTLPLVPVKVPAPVIRMTRLVPPAPVDKVERHLVNEAMVAEVRRALNAWAYEGA